MNKIIYRLISVALAFTLLFGVFAEARAQWTPSLELIANMNMPVQQVVVYNPQNISYDNFGSGIFSQGQFSEASKLPAGSETSLYVDVNKLNGPVGLGTGTRCSATQASADYHQNTITMDGRFCLDFNDAILDGKSVYGMVPTEDIFIHKANGERCSETGNGGEYYMINPASPFIRNYIVMRGAEKLTQHGAPALFMDNLRAGPTALTSRCGGNPKEYPNLNDYAPQMLELARYVTLNLPNYKVQGNLGSASLTAWDDYSFLDGAMCESCFSDWTQAWPTATEMLEDLSVIDKWVQSGHKLYMVVQAPDTTVVSNRFAFAAALLSARDDGANVYFHFGADYGRFYALPEYQYILGTPIAPHVCNGYICTRQFQYGTVRVDFGTRRGTISLAATQVPTQTPTAILPGATPTQPLATPTTTPISVRVRIKSGSDDVEESSGGNMYVTSTDLELVYDSNTQVIGLRFTGVNIPNNATITRAFVQFKVDETSSQTTSLVIQGEASPNAAAFTTTARNVSSRVRTTKAVTWKPLAWLTVGAVGKDQRTPNLAPVIQQIIRQPGWAAGNSLVLILTGSGKRVVESYEGNASRAPLLYIEYTLP